MVSLLLSAAFLMGAFVGMAGEVFVDVGGLHGPRYQ